MDSSDPVTPNKPANPHAPGLTHLNERGEARMVDVGDKAVTRRRAVAGAFVSAGTGVITALREGRVPKGDVPAAARIAGIMAAKRTSDLIPMCHPLALSHAEVAVTVQDVGVSIRATVECVGPTGVEMEALTAASVAALTVYDMCKALDRGMVIEHVRLEEKSGGKSGNWRREEPQGHS